MTRPEDQAAQLTTSLQQPQQQLPQQQHGFNTQTNYQYLRQPVAQHNMLPPGVSITTTLPPPAMHRITPHPPPLQPFQTVQQQQGVSAANGQFMQVPINAQQQQFQEERGLQSNSRQSLNLAQKRVIPREGGIGGPIPATNPGIMPTQLQQPNVTYMHPVHQPPPVEPQQNQEGLQGGLPVTRPEAQAALLTTSLQQPQQQLPHQQQCPTTTYTLIYQSGTPAGRA